MKISAGVIALETPHIFSQAKDWLVTRSGKQEFLLRKDKPKTLD